MEIIDFHQTSDDELRFAGFWIRAGALLIDLIIVNIPYFLIMALVIYLFFIYDIMEAPIAFLISRSINAFWALLTIFYFAFMESSVKQATLGKLVVGIKVGKSRGERLSFLNALGRNFSKILSGLILGIGYIIAALDSKKQGLHDKMADTYVFYK
jgi:uncharacterized RDD family membrane protein YckC